VLKLRVSCEIVAGGNDVSIEAAEGIVRRRYEATASEDITD
jgi:hypothetical protein